MPIRFFSLTMSALALASASLPILAAVQATSGSAQAHAVSANLTLDVPVLPDVVAVLPPVPALLATAPPDFSQSDSAANAALSLGSLGSVLATGVLEVNVSSTLSADQVDAVATTNNLVLGVAPVTPLPPVMALGSDVVTARAMARCTAGNVVVSGSTELVGAQLSLLGAVGVALASNPAPNTQVPVAGVLGLSITLNEQIATATGITVNAIHVRYLNLPVLADLLSGDIIVSHAVASMADCTPAGSPMGNIGVSKTAQGPATTGQSLTFLIRVNNAGPAAAHGTVLTDPDIPNFAPDSLSCGNATGGAVCPSGPTIAALQGAGLVIPSLPANSALEFLLTGAVGAASSISNTATVNVPPGMVDPVPADNIDTEIAPVLPGGGPVALSIPLLDRSGLMLLSLMLAVIGWATLQRRLR